MRTCYEVNLLLEYLTIVVRHFQIQSFCTLCWWIHDLFGFRSRLYRRGFGDVAAADGQSLNHMELLNYQTSRFDEDTCQTLQEGLSSA